MEGTGSGAGFLEGRLGAVLLRRPACGAVGGIFVALGETQEGGAHGAENGLWPSGGGGHASEGGADVVVGDSEAEGGHNVSADFRRRVLGLEERVRLPCVEYRCRLLHPVRDVQVS